MKKRAIIFGFTATSILLFYWIKFDLHIFANQKFHSSDLVFFWFAALTLAVLYVCFIVSFIQIVSRIKRGQHRALKVFALSLTFLFVFFHSAVYSTQPYVDINFYANKENRLDTIQLFQESRLKRIDDGYISPYRMVSLNSIVYFQEEEGILQAMFYNSISIDNRRTVYIYISDDRSFLGENFGYGSDQIALSHTKKIESNWYFSEVQF